MNGFGSGFPKERCARRGRLLCGVCLALFLGIFGGCQAPAALLWLASYLPTGSEPSAVVCPSSSSCIAVGQGGLFLTSQNGGQTWLPANSGLGAALANYNLTSAACLPTNQCTVVGNQGLILNSTNGGQSFSIQNVTTNGNLTFNEVVCQGSGTPACAIVGDNNTLLLQSQSGASWTPDLNVLQAALGPANFNQVVLQGSTIWIAASTTSGTGMNALLLSQNGGTTWSLVVVSQALAPMGVSGIGCTSPTTCFVAGEGALLETTDGGATWSSTLFLGGAAGSSPLLTGIYVGPGNTVWAYGQNGALYEVTSLSSGALSGEAAVAQILPASASALNFTGVTCLSALSCLASGSSLAISGGIFYSSASSGG
ncbi:MAG: YCF48-related protein [Nitrospiraceae bacterium]|nr:YCF48-related protein [Nitrospiraceae bacterium]